MLNLASDGPELLFFGADQNEVGYFNSEELNFVGTPSFPGPVMTGAVDRHLQQRKLLKPGNIATRAQPGARPGADLRQAMFGRVPCADG